MEEVAKLLNLFLRLFQVDKPMTTFLVESLETVARTLCRKFIRKEVLNAADSSLKFSKIDITERLITCLYELNHMKQTRKVKDTKILKFKQEVQQFVLMQTR